MKHSLRAERHGDRCVCVIETYISELVGFGQLRCFALIIQQVERLLVASMDGEMDGQTTGVRSSVDVGVCFEQFLNAILMIADGGEM